MPYVEPVQDHHEPATSTGAFAVHERQTPGSIDSPNDLEAREMLVAISSGDRSALSNLYTSYYGRLAHFLSEFMGSDSRVGDVIDDTFMTIWERARGFAFESKVSVWIFRIAHCHASRFVRSHTPRGLAHCDRQLERQPREPGAETKNASAAPMGSAETSHSTASGIHALLSDGIFRPGNRINNRFAGRNGRATHVFKREGN